jgi:uncharacterized protein YndB with AHSA1/START domain
MAEMRFKTEINSPIVRVFELIADLSNYPRWLAPSQTYSEVTQSTAEPTRLGTTYTDIGRSAKMSGEVTEFEPPRLITFLQTTQSKFAGLKGSITIRIRYTLEEIGNQTGVTRTVSVTPQGVFRLLTPVLLNVVRQESQRILRVMKSHLEG